MFPIAKRLREGSTTKGIKVVSKVQLICKRVNNRRSSRREHERKGIVQVKGSTAWTTKWVKGRDEGVSTVNVKDT